ncbi:MAG: CBS domain-containing protein [Betaproteobacteria bacterium HGW-Betaproteobacteria-11]|nr:MAG: CBS domain-containing protein [Betaproteobacteria bacterium HGW-Betaproteobacteria-11]
MFYVQGIAGQTFRGPLESLDRVAEIARARRVRAIAHDGEELGTQALAAGGGPGAEAIHAYRSMLQIDQERGPLIHAAQIMQSRVIVVAADATVEQAWQVLAERRIHQAPVLDAGQRLVGIVSERDLLTALNVDHGRVRDALALRVTDVMTSPVVYAAPVTDIRRIAQVMLDYGVAGMPIVAENEALAGFISRGDILRAVMIDPPLNLWR